MRSLILSAFILLGLALQGCGSVNPLTAARLSAVSPLKVDPADLAVAIRLPDGVSIPPGAARMVMTAQNQTTGETLQDRIVLAESGGQTRLYNVAPSDHAKLRAFQAQALSWEETDPDASNGSMSFDISFCRTGDGPAPDATTDIAIRLTAGGPLLPLITGAPLSEVASASDIAAMPPC
ncbi:hypothetical protein AB3Y40_00870 [Yoonia sp. R2331]|uniref:hypothetical protein n=1 Tax=Yoonia sp. R2331 TaxID=3237238 RepID=UPI0034E58886